MTAVDLARSAADLTPAETNAGYNTCICLVTTSSTWLISVCRSNWFVSSSDDSLIWIFFRRPQALKVPECDVHADIMNYFWATTWITVAITTFHSVYSDMDVYTSRDPALGTNTVTQEKRNVDVDVQVAMDSLSDYVRLNSKPPGDVHVLSQVIYNHFIISEHISFYRCRQLKFFEL